MYEHYAGGNLAQAAAGASKSTHSIVASWGSLSTDTPTSATKISSAGAVMLSATTAKIVNIGTQDQGSFTLYRGALSISPTPKSWKRQ